MRFVKENRTVEASVGDSILELAEKNGIDLDHACGGVCACSTCHVKITKGAQIVTRAILKDGEYKGNYIDLKPTPAGQWTTLHITLSGGKVTVTCGSQTITEDCETKAGGFVFVVEDGQKMSIQNLRVKK